MTAVVVVVFKRLRHRGSLAARRWSKHHVAICKGFGEYYCRDCSEDYTLEYELEE
ncbi:hypothetical protein D6C79_07194 [Aureobasidium pullulans]|nr:hypothetical protein D6C79_07194 [Aureobasidium pullulans]